MNFKTQLQHLTFGAVLGLLFVMGACNKDTDSYRYVAPANLAVTSFSLVADVDNPGLDSVYFSIDLDHGVIFNADSLRKGTDVSRVIPNVKFSSTVSEATFIMSGGTLREGESDFQKNPTDTIDFTGNVQLRVRLTEDSDPYIYRIKVNVHKMDPDSLFWDNISTRQLPSIKENPKTQKTVRTPEGVCSLIEEADGAYTLARSTDENLSQWTQQSISFPFAPDVSSLLCSGDKLYILGAGDLWQGDTSFSNWTKVERGWQSLIGIYEGSAVGLRLVGNALEFSQYPQADLRSTAVPADFPTSGISNLVTLSNKWTSSPVAFFCGGRTSDGKLSNATWAFDGSEWVKLSQGGIPEMEGASLIPYYNYRPSADGKTRIEYKVWLLLGGRLADGSSSRKVYISYNNAVNWTVGSQSLQLPEIMPGLAFCNNLVIEEAKSADLTDAWKIKLKRPARIPASTDGYIVKWDCPYIYLFGGYGPDGKLNTHIWRGVLGRLTFTPLI